MGAKTARPNREPVVVVDVEGGAITARDVKAARDVIEEVMNERDFTRLSNRINDAVRDSDSSQTRATRDRDRATPRDVSRVESGRLRRALPGGDDFRTALSGRQRKARSVVKNKVMAAAPASQKEAIAALIAGEDTEHWQRVNQELHMGAGDVHQLADGDRVKVQRLDRAIQSYERLNDRTHTVYVAVLLADNHRDVRQIGDLPSTLAQGSVVSFDQFTMCKHNVSETPGGGYGRHVVFEIATSRGMYLGRSDSVVDTTHVLPRGMRFTIGEAVFATHDDGAGGYSSRIVVQLTEEGA